MDYYQPPSQHTQSHQWEVSRVIKEAITGPIFLLYSEVYALTVLNPQRQHIFASKQHRVPPFPLIIRFGQVNLCCTSSTFLTKIPYLHSKQPLFFSCGPFFKFFLFFPSAHRTLKCTSPLIALPPNADLIVNFLQRYNFLHYNSFDSCLHFLPSISRSSSSLIFIYRYFLFPPDTYDFLFSRFSTVCEQLGDTTRFFSPRLSPPRGEHNTPTLFHLSAHSQLPRCHG